MYFAVLVCVLFAGISEADISVEIGGCTVKRFPESSFNKGNNRYEKEGHCEMCYCVNRTANVFCKTCSPVGIEVFPCMYEIMLKDKCYFGSTTAQWPGCCSKSTKICKSSGDFTSVFNSDAFVEFKKTAFKDPGCNSTIEAIVRASIAQRLF
ncbi:uncharacterized protein LOC141902822 [Tubulanus polymorphus]|uniref:uncharacterized protein LOC141902822 n=1 Tax=Tubulanus polymorphus TaxID=672921 RepID=UPI003DA28294